MRRRPEVKTNWEFKRQPIRRRARASKATVPGLLRVVLVLGLVTAGLFIGVAAEFALRMEPSRSAEDLETNAVVFTGQFDRVFAGLDMLREGLVENLFISGVNPGAGMTRERFAMQFSLDANLQRALASGRLALGERAENTLENAAETACWYKRRGLSGPLLLITSCLHMPRASLALERSLSDVDVVRMCLSNAAKDVTTEALINEFKKFIVTLVVAPIGGMCATAGASIVRNGTRQ